MSCLSPLRWSRPCTCRHAMPWQARPPKLGWCEAPCSQAAHQWPAARTPAEPTNGNWLRWPGLTKKFRLRRSRLGQRCSAQLLPISLGLRGFEKQILFVPRTSFLFFSYIECGNQDDWWKFRSQYFRVTEKNMETSAWIQSHVVHWPAVD